jgi:low affinity Fe/Cu permease
MFLPTGETVPMVEKSRMPGDAANHEKLGWFDRFATRASKVVSRAAFFAFCVVLVVVWAPSIVLLRSISVWQLIINTITTIITFLLVALLQNSQERSDKAVQQKLNAIADSLSDLMKANGLDGDAAELREAVGLEDRESSKD